MKQNKSGWRQFFNSTNVWLVVTGFASSTGAAVATIYSAPIVVGVLATIGASAFNVLVIRELRGFKKAQPALEAEIIKKTLELENADNKRYEDGLGRFNQVPYVANAGIICGAIGLANGLATGVVTIARSKTSSEDSMLQSNNISTALTLTGGAAILFGFTVYSALGNRNASLLERQRDLERRVLEQKEDQIKTAGITTRRGSKDKLRGVTPNLEMPSIIPSTFGATVS